MNSRLDTIQAAILLEKLSEFPQELIARNNAALSYSYEFKDRYKIPFLPDGYTSAWAQYTLLARDRDAAMASFKSEGVPTMIYYATCMHQQSVFIQRNSNSKNLYPVAEKLSLSVFSLPMHPYL